MAELMKESGISWIGAIPLDWNIRPIAYMSDSRSGGTPDRNNMLFWEDGTIPWMSSGEVNKVNVYDTDEKITLLATQSSSAKVIPKTAVMVALNGQGKTKGMSAILHINSACNQSLCAFSCYTGVLHYEYLFWCFQTMYTYLRRMSGDDVRDGLAASYVRKQKIPVPLYREQRAIADFLDRECAQIDSIAADLEKQIELLQQYKKSLITETVTPNKQQNWNRTKIKYVGGIRGRIGFRGYTVEDTVDPDTPGCAVVLGGTNIMRDGTTNYENLTFLSENKYFESPEIMLRGGEVLITKVGAGTGENSVYDGRFERATINPNVMIFIPTKLVNPQYINYVLLSKAIKEDMKVESTKSGAQPAINQGYVNNLVIYVPKLELQNEITNYLDSKCSEIDSTIEIKEKQLQVIQQHKKSLIYEYVTGKKRVKEVQ